MNEAIICTIATKKYLAHVRTLAQTFLHHHPGGRVFMLLVDEIEGLYDPAAEPFTTILVRDLNFPQLSAMFFRYTTFELICALKPYFLDYLFREYGYHKICYFDTDITINHPLDEIFALLDSRLLVLTPHLLDFLEDGLHPDDHAILQAGAYNAGFIGVAQHPELKRFLYWWQRKLEKHSIVDVAQGLVADQHWLDLMPGLFADVYILRDPGCNIAYWNFNHRRIEQTETGYTANDSPVKFFHFSGFSIEKMETISAHQDRYTLSDLPQVQPIFEQYRDDLIENGYHTVTELSGVYEFFDNGVRIPNYARYLWRRIDQDGLRWPEPFKTQAKNSFINWLNAPADGVDWIYPLITNLAIEIFHQRPDLQQAFPKVLGGDRLGFAQWFVTYAPENLQLDQFFVEPVVASLARIPEAQLKAAKSSTDEDSIEPLDREQLSRAARTYLTIRDFVNRIGVGPRVKAVIGSEQVWKVRQLFFYSYMRENQRSQTDNVSSRPPFTKIEPPQHNGYSHKVQKPFGLNVIGYLRDEIGIGEVARSILKVLDDKNFPVAQLSVSNNEARADDTSVLHLPSGNPYAINLWNVNADAAGGLYQVLGAEFFQNYYNIGFWFWELAQFPEIWQSSFSYFQEIWVASSFVQGAVAACSPIPVVNIRVPIIKPAASTITRADLGLPPDKHLFLFVFDGLSYVERKNPLELIQAYRTAFEPSFQDTSLVIKATNLHRNPKVAQCLKEEMERVSGVLIDSYLSREELNGLFHNCDTYVSLHRSEGFGLTIAEAMSLGKPVMATAYSANMDFMNPANSYPVSYRLVEIEEDHGPYKKGNVWAAPDIIEAAALMKRIIDNPAEAQRKGQRAQQDIEQSHGVESVSQIIIKRLETIRGWL